MTITAPVKRYGLTELAVLAIIAAARGLWIAVLPLSEVTVLGAAERGHGYFYP